MGPWGLIGVVTEHFLDLVLPRHIEGCGQVDPAVGTNVFHEAPVLGRQPDVLMAKPLLQELLVAAGDDPDLVARVGGEGVQDVVQARRWNGGGRVLDNGGQGTVVVEQEHTTL